MTIINKCPILQAIFGKRRPRKYHSLDHPALESVSTEFLEYDMQTVPMNYAPQRLMTRYMEYYIPTVEMVRTARELPTHYF